MITQELLNDLFCWDRDSGRFFWKNPPKNHGELKNKEAGFLTRKGYWVITINTKRYKRGRLCFFMEFGRFPYPCVDHKNGIRHDDRLNNLRESSITENAWNHSNRKKKSGLPMGVRLTSNGKYLARIKVNKTSYSLGAYETIQEALNIYKQKRKEFYGEFAERPTGF